MILTDILITVGILAMLYLMRWPPAEKKPPVLIVKPPRTLGPYRTPDKPEESNHEQ